MTGVVIAGFGPAGVGVLTGALWGGAFGDLLDAGVVAVDRGPADGSGRLGRYAIESDSHVESFVAALGAWEGNAFVPRGPWAVPAVQALGQHLDTFRGGPVPLPLAAQLQSVLRDLVLENAALRGRQILRTGTEVIAAQRNPGGWTVSLSNGDGMEQIQASSLVLAGGATQRPADLAEVKVAGVRLSAVLPHRPIGSDDVLRHAGKTLVHSRLEGRRSPRIAVVGASHSAMAVVNVLLSSGLDLGPGAVTVLHRQPMRATYQSPAQARAEGFEDFGADDVCPRTGRVFPLAGFRCASRELLLRVKGYGGRSVEDRVHLWPLQEREPHETLALLRSSDLVILATGYRRESVPLYDVGGEPLLIRGIASPGPLVDHLSRVSDTEGQVVPGLFATGLGAGFPLAGTHGEPSFTGNANGTSLWQTEIGEQIARSVVARHHARVES